MQKLSDMIRNPGGLDSLDNYMGTIPDDEWLVVLTRCRDSNCLEESNWEAAIKLLGGEDESAGVLIERFGHWACGWWESLSVRAGSDKEAIGQEIHEGLEDYPVLDEEDLCEREQVTANDIWKTCFDWRERIDYIRKNPDQIEPRDFADLMACARGEYFLGYANELIS